MICLPQDSTGLFTSHISPLQALDYTEGLEGEEAVVTAEEADAAPVQEV